jgi:hypothetical protein
MAIVLRRPAVVTAIVFGTFVFLGISFLLARGLTGTNVERGKVLDVLEAQAAGDTAKVLQELPVCRTEPTCVATTRARVKKLAHPGRVEILAYSPSAQLSLTRQVGTGRVAWRIGARLPTVQCVRVKREGPLTGGGVTLLSFSDPIKLDGSC